jgi:hypothetical protein
MPEKPRRVSTYYGCQHLMAAINLLAPTDRVQRAFVALLHKMEAAGDPEDKILATLATALAKGLNHNNWPNAEHISAERRPGYAEGYDRLRGFTDLKPFR